MSWFSRSQDPVQLQLKLKITVIVEPDEPGFHAYCPALEGLHVGGDTEQEALENAKDAVMVYLTSLAEHGDPLPVGPDCIVEHEQVEAYRVPAGAFLRYLELQWPSPSMSGSR